MAHWSYYPESRADLTAVMTLRNFASRHSEHLMRVHIHCQLASFLMVLCGMPTSWFFSLFPSLVLLKKPLQHKNNWDMELEEGTMEMQGWKKTFSSCIVRKLSGRCKTMVCEFFHIRVLEAIWLLCHMASDGQSMRIACGGEWNDLHVPYRKPPHTPKAGPSPPCGYLCRLGKPSVCMAGSLSSNSGFSVRLS